MVNWVRRGLSKVLAVAFAAAFLVAVSGCANQQKGRNDTCSQKAGAKGVKTCSMGDDCCAKDGKGCAKGDMKGCDKAKGAKSGCSGKAKGAKGGCGSKAKGAKGAKSGCGGGKATAMKAFNTTCPISGKPVTAGVSVDYKGKTVGFFCNTCKGKWQNLSDADKDQKLAGLK